jgi:ammonium transporter, Amt family
MSQTPPPAINAADTAWLLISTALVLLMTPALGFFYGGLVRRKNVLSTIMHSFFTLALVSIVWVLWGYSLAFSKDVGGGLIGGLDWLALNNVGVAPNPDYAGNIPHLLFMMFQLTFAAITPALITGAFAERKRFKAFVLFIVLWSTFVYSPLAHWVWGVGGWIRGLGALDFAGGTVVHISSGVAALVCAIVIGRRTGFGSEKYEPHDVTKTVLGAALLWFGWFGFNAGSALAANEIAVLAFVNTSIAAAMAALSWVTAGWIHKKQPSVLGAAAGAVAGLVAITPAAGFVDTRSAILIGFVAGVACYAAVGLKEVLKVDDALDVFAVHGVGGIWGALATGIFTSKAVNSAGQDGVIAGNFGQLGVQLIAVVAAAAFSGVMTFIILMIVKAVVPLRVADKEEEMGLDTTQHGEPAYTL